MSCARVTPGAGDGVSESLLGGSPAGAVWGVTPGVGESVTDGEGDSGGEVGDGSVFSTNVVTEKGVS